VKHNKAFTIVELLIAMSLSAFILLSLTQSYQAVLRYIDNCRGIMTTNRQVCLLFNLMERDFTTAFIPTIHKEVVPAEEKEKSPLAAQMEKDKADKESAQPKTPEEERKAKEKEKDKIKDFFLGESDDSEQIKIGGKKAQTLKKVTFINTNPLQIFGQKRSRFVRVMYALAKDKERSSGEQVCYMLERKESEDIENVKMKESEFDNEKKSSAQTIRSHVVAEKIKSMSVEYVTIKKEKEDKKDKSSSNSEPTEIKTFTWGDQDYSKGVVPKFVNVRISFWDDETTDEHAFNAVFPVLSYPTEKDESEDDEKKEDEDESKKSKDQKPKDVQGAG
jgi:hypothetical protein